MFSVTERILEWARIKVNCNQSWGLAKLTFRNVHILVVPSCFIVFRDSTMTDIVGKPKPERKTKEHRTLLSINYYKYNFTKGLIWFFPYIMAKNRWQLDRLVHVIAQYSCASSVLNRNMSPSYLKSHMCPWVWMQKTWCMLYQITLIVVFQ